MDVVPYVKAGRTYLPVRAVSEALSMDVEWESETQTVTLTSPYQTGRILVEAERFDATGLNAEKIVSDGDGLWIMQFSSPSEARAAALMLEARGLQVEPDKYIPPIDEQPIIATSTSGKYYSWGVTDCKFDSFIESYSNLLSSSGIVAVVDTGIDSTHSLLHGRTLAGYDFVDGDADPSPTDNEYHGTHVAGTILDCVGDTPVNILPIRVLGSNGGTTAAVVAGIKYAVSRSADVVNLSLGGRHSNAVDSAIKNAVDSGTLIVVAAGNANDATSRYCPAHTSELGTIVASAGSINHTRASFSNFGENIDVIAPGVGIVSSVPGNRFASLSGTSMAAPHAAAAAILLDLAWGKELSPAELENKIHTATSYGSWRDQYGGFGFIDMSKADVPARGVEPVPDPIPEPMPIPSISLSKNDVSMKMGDKETLYASTTPAGATVSWKSENPNIAMIDDSGVINAIAAGFTTIQAEMIWQGQRYSASCKVTVVEPAKSGSDSFVVTFDANGGVILDSVKKVTNNSTYGALPTPTRVDFVFQGWYTARKGGVKIESNTIVSLTDNQTLYAHWLGWGEWSKWSTTPITESDTRQVQTRNTKISDSYIEYRYGRFVDQTMKHDCWCSTYLESLPYISGKASLQYSAWSTTRYSANEFGWTCGFCNGNHIGIDHVGDDGRAWWAEYILPGNQSYYWEDTRTVPAVYQMQYRYRDLIELNA